VHPCRVEQRGDRVLGQPVDLQAGVQPLELGGDGEIAPGVP
jgi:hypothetical protein